MNGNGSLPPQVIRRSDGSFHILNADLSQLTQLQRMAVGVLVWDQVRALMEASGEYKAKEGFNGTSVGSMDDIDRMTAQAAAISAWSAFSSLRPRLLQNPSVTQRLLDGEFKTVADVARVLGKRTRYKMSEGRPSGIKPGSVYFGKSDRFLDAITPIQRYLVAWRKKGFLFTHVNPKEAKRRIRVIDQVMDDLIKAREDLERRSRVATLRVDSRNRERRRS